MPAETIAVLGAGVGGMCAAHMLARLNLSLVMYALHNSDPGSVEIRSRNWYRTLGIVLMLGVLVCGCVDADDDDDVAIGETGEKIAKLVQEYHDAGRFSGVVLAARDGKVVCARAVGSLGNGSGDPLQTTTLFEIASSTKPFTAMAALVLVEQGKLDLDKSISDYLPDVPNNCQGITVRHLIQHTSGIPGTNTSGRGNDLKAVLPTFLEGGPRHPPGTHWEYWNQGYALLSEVIARVGGQSYVAFCRDEIFQKAGLTHSGFVGDQTVGPPNTSVATGKATRIPDRSALQPAYDPKGYGFEYRGMGGMVTNVHDLWKIDRALSDQKILNAKSIQEMITPGLADYALGWRIGKDPDGKSYHHHNGRTQGFLASLNRYPSIEGCVFVLCNDEAQVGMFELNAACERLLFGKAPIPMKQAGNPNKPKTLPQRTLNAIVGDYSDAKGRKLSIRDSNSFGSALIDWNNSRKSTGTIVPGVDGKLLWRDRQKDYPITFDIEQGEAVRCRFMSGVFERDEK